MSRRATWIAAATIIVLVSVAAGVYLFGHRVPAGQPGVVDLTSATLPRLQKDFNDNADRTRLVVLLSPT